ncbi:response regulator [Thermomonas carbonis]|uniref:Response regulator transcription factor n=1 Tax=Thermomonas carbonis TaxID=1463158 RepID=A0A7G9STE7_9GAMM|nr:response regulator transcription factor [Thermomonas carbonis]QNN71122.1 response regulator transcription factor [Thermomonas carbonis]GHC12389.1 DNA-binding response regulator [Thermomonas carbonis]
MQAQVIALQTVLVVEDDPIAQVRAIRLLREVAGDAVQVDVAGDIASAQDGLDAGKRYDLALVDMQLPDGNGIDFIAWMRAQRPTLPAVVVSSWAEEETILAALRNGAIGYLLKNAEDIELAMHLRSLQRGGAAIDPIIARRLLELMPQTPPTPAPRDDIHLSARETEILQLVSRGLSNREIADAVSLSRLTIESHVRNIYRKLAVGSRTAAVFEAQSLGLLH